MGSRRVAGQQFDEVSRRDSAAGDLRARDAHLDPGMRIELWDKTSKVSFDKCSTTITPPR